MRQSDWWNFYFGNGHSQKWIFLKNSKKFTFGKKNHGEVHERAKNSIIFWIFYEIFQNFSFMNFHALFSVLTIVLSKLRDRQTSPVRTFDKMTKFWQKFYKQILRQRVLLGLTQRRDQYVRKWLFFA